MGTHAAFVRYNEDGTHDCVERTMDGGQLLEVLDGCIKDQMEPGRLSKVLLDAEWGSGSVERGSEREGEEEYFVAMGFKTRVLYVYPGPFDLGLFRAYITWCTRYGWTLGGLDNCDCGSEA
jgi:hypothetical protein